MILSCVLQAAVLNVDTSLVAFLPSDFFLYSRFPVISLSKKFAPLLTKKWGLPGGAEILTCLFCLLWW